MDAHKNFAYSTVATAPSPATSGTSLVVAAGQGALFPAVPFNATVWPAGTQPTAANAEIVRVTNVATDTFTITRAQETSSARTVVVGDQIAATITAKTLQDVEVVDAATGTGSLRTLGTGALQAAAGNDSRLSDSRAPSGSASGDLAGSYPSPTVAKIHETSGPTALTIGTVADNEYLKRSGTTLISGSPPGLGVANDAIWDTKGDLAVGTGADTAAKLAVGSNNTVLVADSTVATYGVKWVQVGEAMIALTNVTTNNVTSSAHGFAPKSPGDATKFLHGAATPDYAQVKDSDLSTSNVTSNDVTISKHGFAPKAPNSVIQYLDGTGAYSIPGTTPTVGGPAGVLLYDYTVTGSAKASIDTNVDDGGNGAAALPGGYGILEVFLIHRTDEALGLTSVNVIVNNDATSIYDRQTVRSTSTTAAGANGVASSGWDFSSHGTTGGSYPSMTRITIPGYAATVFQKVGETTGAVIDGTASSQRAEENVIGWRNTAAINRLKIAVTAGGTTKLAVGSRMIIYAR